MAIHDSGTRREFPSGAMRDRGTEPDGSLKSRPALIPPEFRLAVGSILAQGALKYDDRNWEKGFPTDDILDSLHRHLAKLERGDTDEDHLALLGCNVVFLVTTIERIVSGKLPEELANTPGLREAILERKNRLKSE